MRASVPLRFVRWMLLLLGGVLLGAGLVVHGQVAVAEHMRAQVRETFFLWRGVGRISFVFQDDQTKMALWLHELDPKVLDHSRRAASVLLTLGLLLALAAPWMTCERPARRRSS